ncbi:MAG: hypothetical protein JJ992_07285 [Planctomycetes bacterium]|nr:hypothetical protein [Planctomycetota bacterium]
MRPGLLLAVILSCSVVRANDWLTFPSTYSHDAQGNRVTQYAPIAAPTASTLPSFQTSGYTHTRSSLNYGQSADNYHRVEEWGPPVRPYGEWRFPYRPFSTPYPNWGPPYAGLNLGFPFAAPYAPYGGGPYVGNPARGDRHGDGGPGYGGLPYRPRGYERGYLGDGRWPTDRHRFPGTGVPASPMNPYPAGPGSPYPVPPYYDGYYPNYRQ